MAPSDSDTRAYTKQAAITRALGSSEGETGISPKAKKKRDAIHNLIYPFRPRSAPAPASEKPSVADEVKAAPEGVKKKVKKVRFALNEAIATPKDDESKGSNPK